MRYGTGKIGVAQQEGEHVGPQDAPANILDEAGIDIRKAEFWQGGYDVLSQMIDQLEALPVKVLEPGS